MSSFRKNMRQQKWLELPAIVSSMKLAHGLSMDLSDFITRVQSSSQPILLLEGTRALPLADAPRLTALSARLAIALPKARFRLGNSSGSEEMFLYGLATVSERVELVMPSDGNRPGADKARRKSLQDASSETLRELVRLSIQATPRYSNMFNRYIGNELSPEHQAKARHLLRAALKVHGCPHARLAPATVALLYLNHDDHERGCTGHIRRLCSVLNVPVWSQHVWLGW